ncbi:hypothetical protein pb186bvf_007569 [Paramecium bursaria]
MQNNPPLKGNNKIRIVNPFVPPTMIQDNRNRTKIFTDLQMPLENKFQQQQQPQQPMPFQNQLKDGIIDDMPYQNFQQQLAHQQLDPTMPFKFGQPNNNIYRGSNEQLQNANYQQKNEYNTQGIILQNKQVGQNLFQNPIQDNPINQIGYQQNKNLIKLQTQPNIIQNQPRSPIAKQVDQYAFQNQFQESKPSNQVVNNKKYDDFNREERDQQMKNINYDWQYWDHLSREQILANNDLTQFDKYLDEADNLTKHAQNDKPIPYEQLQAADQVFPYNMDPYASYDSNQQFQPLNPQMAKHYKKQQQHPEMKQQIPPNPPLPNFKQNPPYQQPAQFNPNLLQNPPAQQPPQVVPTNEVKQQDQQIQKKQIHIMPCNQINKRPNEQQKQQQKQKIKQKNSDHIGQKKNIQLHDLHIPFQRDAFGLNKGQNVNQLMEAQKQLGIDQMDDAQLYEYFTQMDINAQKGLSSNVIQEIQTFKMQDEQIEEECSICYEIFVRGDDLCSLPCLHIFHSNCIKKCFERSKICPICRQPVI